MLISDQKQFIFVHIEKTAGTSITAALEPFSITPPGSKWHSILRAFNLPGDYRQYKYPMHGGLVEAQKKIPVDRYERYFKFAFVRNPWDRLVSEYNAAIKKNRRHRHRKIKAMESFSEYVLYEIRRNKLKQLPKILNIQGEIGLDYVGRFERLYDDFSHICDVLDIEITLEKLNAFKHPEYREYYDSHTRDLVSRHWGDDIEAFGYEF